MTKLIFDFFWLGLTVLKHLALSLLLVVAASLFVYMAINFDMDAVQLRRAGKLAPKYNYQCNTTLSPEEFVRYWPVNRGGFVCPYEPTRGE